MDEMVRRHQVACNQFAAVADDVQEWILPTPCTEWDTRAIVEHVIGFHEFLLLRPLGVRAHRPREGPADRWRATSAVLFDALATDGVLDRPTELPGGGESSARTMLSTLTTDVLVPTWDLARAAQVAVTLDPALCADAYAAAVHTGIGRDHGMVGPAIEIAPAASAQDQLIAFYGRDPAWTPPTPA